MDKVISLLLDLASSDATLTTATTDNRICADEGLIVWQGSQNDWASAVIYCAETLEVYMVAQEHQHWDAFINALMSALGLGGVFEEDGQIVYLPNHSIVDTAGALGSQKELRFDGKSRLLNLTFILNNETATLEPIMRVDLDSARQLVSGSVGRRIA